MAKSLSFLNYYPMSNFGSKHSWVAKCISLSIYSSALIAVILSNMAVPMNGFEPNSSKFTFQNISVGLVIATFVLGIILKQLQKGVYTLFGTHELLDERQKSVRNKVFERAYIGIIILVLLSMFFVDRSTSHARGVASWLLISAIINLPAMLASFEKNS